MARGKSKGLLAHIVVRHAKGCAQQGPDCCAISYLVRIRRLQITRTFHTLPEAIAFRDEALERHALGGAPVLAPAGQTLACLADEFIAACEKGDVISKRKKPYAHNTVLGYENSLRVHVLGRTLRGYRVPIGELPPSAFDADCLELLVRVVNAEAGPGAARYANAAVCAMFRYAAPIKEWGVKRLPSCDLLPAPSKPKERVLSDDEVKWMMAAAFEDDDRLERCLSVPLLVLLDATGGRVTEVTSLDFQHDPDRPGLDLWSEPAVIRVDKAKTPAGERRVPIREWHRTVLLSCWDEMGCPADGTPVLPSGGAAGRLTRSGAYQIVERLAASAQIEDLSPHDFRRTHATELMEAGVPVHLAIARLGHSHPSTFFRNYVRNRDGADDEVLEKLDARRRR